MQDNRNIVAGIYLHIPFCKQACHYCDFHFSTNLDRKSQMIETICHELELRKDELQGETIHSIYFGGGTPSLLSQPELQSLLQAIHENFGVDDHAEITLEANPDDLDEEKLHQFKSAGVNRLSIGIQTFDEARLKYINRAHSAIEAKKSLDLVKQIGFENVSADLIYAIPPEGIDYWENDLNTLLAYDLAHVSLYGLTIEEKTVFGKWAKKGKLYEVPEETAAKQYQLAIDLLTAHGYEHYEVSNFAKPGMYSRHNSAYWDDQVYLGVGPGAHSYDGASRSYNISNNAKYTAALAKDTLALTREVLTATDKVNEYLFTHLRTKKGVDLRSIRSTHAKDLLMDYPTILSEFENQGLIQISTDHLKLTSKGFMIADEITWRLFYED